MIGAIERVNLQPVLFGRRYSREVRDSSGSSLGGEKKGKTKMEQHSWHPQSVIFRRGKIVRPISARIVGDGVHFKSGLVPLLYLQVVVK